jgi:hypothetical protein
MWANNGNWEGNMQMKAGQWPKRQWPNAGMGGGGMLPLSDFHPLLGFGGINVERM